MIRIYRPPLTVYLCSLSDQTATNVKKDKKKTKKRERKEIKRKSLPFDAGHDKAEDGGDLKDLREHVEYRHVAQPYHEQQIVVEVLGIHRH